MASELINISLPNPNWDIYYTDFCGVKFRPYVIRKEIVLSVNEKEAERFGRFIKKTKDGIYVLPVTVTDRSKIAYTCNNQIFVYGRTPGVGYLCDHRFVITKAELCVDLFTAYAPNLEVPLKKAFLISMDADAIYKPDSIEEKYIEITKEKLNKEGV